ncbi:RNA polymerase sigma factor [Conexibacter stalactiti]|uniref:RNA polymerase sigma factor n=1 Tax=Conexibacter stalactiti TaxID=1940611 RepID=A0ABU4HXK8_9ACTN|nr:RNA polymerase sigma factor [Conexibacter stalactiti]MDW5598060.1 RNA polymerase sigma factor [Conexibacter stalactiti]MEC5038702.1 RNA polymerase sigma factor [Conexibacter stalactiti]
MAPTTTATAALASTLVPPREARGRERSDGALVAGALAGEQAALDALFQRHWPAAYRVALLIVHDHAAAEDVAQEAFVAAVRRLERFDRRRPFAPWLMKIAANRAIDWTRSRGRRQEVSAPEPRDDGAVAPLARNCSEELLSALAALAPEQRAVVVLRHLLEWTPGEIARALELPRGTVNSRLRRGLDALRRALEEERG